MNPTELPSPGLPSIADLREAARRIAGQAVVTPLLESPSLNARLGGRLLVKAEPLQRTGSFKFRGACNALAQLDASGRRSGVVAWSSGNHAQAVAAAAQLFGIPALIVMPSDAPSIKLSKTRECGAEIVLYDRRGESREAIGRRLAGERCAAIIAPYDDPLVIAGQGTCGLEIAAQAAAAGVALDALIVNCSGGGLAAGCCLALAADSPETAVLTAEPAGFDDMARSLAAGRRVANTPGASSICDALQAPEPGVLTFAIAGPRLAGGLVVTDAEIVAAMRLAFSEFRLVLEPSGAAALAAATGGRFAIAGKTIAVIASGGNVDPATFAAALRADGSLSAH